MDVDAKLSKTSDVVCTTPSLLPCHAAPSPPGASRDLRFVELRVRRLLQVSSGQHEDHPVTESLLRILLQQ
jgi:hypothetical protein